MPRGDHSAITATFLSSPEIFAEISARSTSLQKIRSRDRIFFRLGKPSAKSGGAAKRTRRGRLPRRNLRQQMKPGKTTENQHEHVCSLIPRKPGRRMMHIRCEWSSNGQADFPADET